MDYAKLNKIFNFILLRVNLTNNQRRILTLIYHYSWFKNKEYAVIPLLKCFRLTGIKDPHITRTISELKEINIIIQIDKKYTINSDTKSWKIQKGFITIKEMQRYLGLLDNEN